MFVIPRDTQQSFHHPVARSDVSERAGSPLVRRSVVGYEWNPGPTSASCRRVDLVVPFDHTATMVTKGYAVGRLARSELDDPAARAASGSSG